MEVLQSYPAPIKDFRFATRAEGYQGPSQPAQLTGLQESTDNIFPALAKLNEDIRHNHYTQRSVAQ